RGSAFCSAIDQRSRTFCYTNLLAVLNTETDAGRLAILRIDDSQVGQMDRRFFRDNAGFLSLCLALMTLHNIYTTDECFIILWHYFENFAFTALVLTGQHDNAVAFANLLHRLASLQNFRSQRDDLHVALSAKFTRNRSEDTRTNRLFLVINEDGCIVIKTDNTAVRTTNVFGGTYNYRLHYVTFFDAAARDSFLDRHHNDVANGSVTPLGTAQHLDAHDTTCAGVIRHVEVCLHLNHDWPPSFPSAG